MSTTRNTKYNRLNLIKRVYDQVNNENSKKFKILKDNIDKKFKILKDIVDKFFLENTETIVKKLFIKQKCYIAILIKTDDLCYENAVENVKNYLSDIIRDIHSVTNQAFDISYCEYEENKNRYPSIDFTIYLVDYLGISSTYVLFSIKRTSL